MNNFINSFTSLPGVNMLCECTHSDDVCFTARLVINSKHPGNLWWLQSNNIITNPDGIKWRYVIDDPDEREKEAIRWFSKLKSYEAQG